MSKTRSQTASPADLKEALREALRDSDVADSLSANILERLTQKLVALVDVAVEEACKKFENALSTLASRVGALENENNRINKLVAQRTDELEQYQRRTSLRIFGIEERKGESTDEIVSEFFKSKLGVTVETYDLCRTHRVGPPPRPRSRREGEGGSPPPPRHRAILVKFSTYNVRRYVFSAKKKLKDSGYVITEDLTSIRRKLFLDAVQMYGKRNVWSIDGVIKWKGADGVIHRATTAEELRVS